MTIAILQARLSSTRLPGKVLKTILGKPMLELLLERVERSMLVQKIIIATSTDRSDDSLKKFCEARGISVVRGNLNDVLDRFYQAAIQFKADSVVRLTGDCPLLDPDVIDQAIEKYQSGNFDYVSNTINPTMPDGLDVEVFGMQVLRLAWKEAKLSSEREHVTPFIHKNGTRFRLGEISWPENLHGLRLTVDESGDFELIKRIYEKLYPLNPAFSTQDVLDLLGREPELLQLNIGLQRNAGYQRSVEQDHIINS